MCYVIMMLIDTKLWMQLMVDLLQEWSQNIVGLWATGLTIPASKPGRNQRFLGVEPAQPPFRWVSKIFTKGNTVGA